MSIPFFAFTGRAYDVGYQHGQALKENIRAFAAYRLQRCIDRANAAGGKVGEGAVLELAVEHLKILDRYAPELHQELEGMSEGSGVGLPHLLLLNGYTDFIDTLLQVVTQGNATAEPVDPHGCTAFFAAGEATRHGGPLIGQTWDMDAHAEPHVVGVHLSVTGRPPCLLLTHAGCVAVAGVNANGIALAINNLKPTDARLGVPWVFVVRKVLACRDFDSAFLELQGAPYSSGHNYLLCDEDGRAVNIESTGAEAEVLDFEGPTFVHANHYCHQELLPLAQPLSPTTTTCRRQERLAELLKDRAGRLDVPELHRCLSDPEVEIAPPGRAPSPGEPPAVSCATAIFDPAARVAYLRRGHPSGGELMPVDFRPV